MKKENKIIMKEARESLAGKWKLSIGTFFVCWLITASIPAGIKNSGFIVSLLISGPFILGISSFSLSMSRNKKAKFEQLFYGFKKYEKTLIAYLLVLAFTLLWSLLLIVPGIIAAISYSQTFFILADDESISASDAIKKSKKIMNGNKWKFVCLLFRFFGWFILSILTLGIGFLWLSPYMHVSTAKFYDSIKS